MVGPHPVTRTFNLFGDARMMIGAEAGKLLAVAPICALGPHAPARRRRNPAVAGPATDDTAGSRYA
jgi:hypothetical protein